MHRKAFGEGEITALLQTPSWISGGHFVEGNGGQGSNKGGEWESLGIIPLSTIHGSATAYDQGTRTPACLFIAH